MNITGTGKQIASKVNELAGGVSFSSGATSVRKFESGGLLGSSLPIPNYKSSIGGDSNSELVHEIRVLAQEQSKRIDRLTVYQDTNSVTSAQKKIVKQNQIGILG